MKPYNSEPSKGGKALLNNAKSGIKNSIRVVLQPRRRGTKRVIGLMFVIAGYSWHILQKDNTPSNNLSVAENRLIPPVDKDVDFSSLNENIPTDKNQENKSFNAISDTSTELIDASIPPQTVEKERIFHTIKHGESLGTILETYKFPATLPYQIVNAKNGDLFKKIRAGKQLEFILNKDSHQLEEIHYPHSKLTQLVANVTGDITVGLEDIDYEIIHANASGNITHSLFGAASEAGISDLMITELTEIFGWDVDFVKDIRKGDSFKVIYEQYMNQGNMIQEGRVVAAEFVNNGQTFTAIRHEDSDGIVGYYAPDGSSMKGTFLKSPMKFSRISSGFSNKRFHPILKKWRAHKGVDYAARTGTPIRSVANGKVIHRGSKGGYGKTVVISHGGKYTTLYAHMSKYHAKAKHGQHVKQGQIIGYVGSTGLSTGPHLHYEFRVNGVHRNPLTYKTPKASAISSKERVKFEENLKNQIAALNGIRTGQDDSNLVAQAINMLNNADDILLNNPIENALK